MPQTATAANIKLDEGLSNQSVLDNASLAVDFVVAPAFFATNLTLKIDQNIFDLNNCLLVARQ